MIYHFLHVFMNEMSVFIVSKYFLDIKTSQISCNSFLQPDVRPLFGGNEATVELTGNRMSCQSSG